MKRLLRAVLACLRKPDQPPFQGGGVRRFTWRAVPMVEGCHGRPADSPFGTLTVIELHRVGGTSAALGAVEGVSDSVEETKVEGYQPSNRARPQ
jgi:hypothetical protein